MDNLMRFIPFIQKDTVLLLLFFSRQEQKRDLASGKRLRIFPAVFSCVILPDDAVQIARLFHQTARLSGIRAEEQFKIHSVFFHGIRYHDGKLIQRRFTAFAYCPDGLLRIRESGNILGVDISAHAAAGYQNPVVHKRLECAADSHPADAEQFAEFIFRRNPDIPAV